MNRKNARSGLQFAPAGFKERVKVGTQMVKIQGGSRLAAVMIAGPIQIHEITLIPFLSVRIFSQCGHNTMAFTCGSYPHHLFLPETFHGRKQV